MSYYDFKFAKFGAENFPLFYSYNKKLELNYYEFQDFKKRAFSRELLKLLRILDFCELKSIARSLRLSLDDEELYDKIVKYMLSHLDYAFGNNQLRQFLAEYHRFFDELLIDQPWLDMAEPEPTQEEGISDED